MGRPRKPLISREAATRAALDLIDESGLPSFSLGAVAKRMSIQAPSLYYHFHDKAELLAEVARFVLLKVELRRDEGLSWEDRMVDLCVATRRALLRHPNAAPLILQFFPRHVLLQAYENALTGYTQTTALRLVILEGIEKLTYGSALFEAAARARGMPAMPAVDPRRFPNLAECLAANTFDDEELFIEALRMFLAGVRARTEVISPPRRSPN